MPIFQELPMGLPGGANQPRDAVETKLLKNKTEIDTEYCKYLRVMVNEYCNSLQI